MIRKVLLSVPLTMLAACSVPHAVPGGYTYHSDVYKSATPSPSSKVTKSQRAKMGPQQAQQFRDALYDLVDRLTERAGLPPKAVHVIPHEPMNAFYAQVDNDLREAMRHVGYRLASTSEDGYYFTYEAAPIAQAKLDEGEYPAAAGMNHNNVELSLKVFNGFGKEAVMLTEQSGQYYIEGAESYFGPQLPSFLSNTTARED
jgi:hypothetical protein